MIAGKRIILGVTGGIAAYKAIYLLRRLQRESADVRVTMTESATRFVGTETFSSLSKHEVLLQPFPGNQKVESRTPHIHWGEWADLFIIAPCTANTLAKIAHGLSDNMLTSTVLAARCPLLICPTMDGNMYRAPSMQRNLDLIRFYGYHFLEPEKGHLASGLKDIGRLPELGTIIQKVKDILSDEQTQGILSGKKVLVTAGPTREHLDPVRFLSNPSSGKMGFAMAEAARDKGADVTLIHGPVHLSPPPGIQTIEIESVQELFEQVKEHADADVIIMAAAVSDFSPGNYHSQKMKKDSMETFIKLQKTQDVLAWLGQNKRKEQTLIGFAMETEDLIENAQSKLENKNLDWIVANSLTEEKAGFGSDNNSVQLINDNTKKAISGTKKKVAELVLDTIFGAE